MEPTDCNRDPFGAEGSDWEVRPPPDPDDFEYLDSPDLFT